MKAKILMAAYFITLPLIIAAQNASGIAKISMLLSLDQSSNYKIHFQFLTETFQQFYSCLRYSSWRTCIGSVSSNPPPPFPLGSDDKYVASVVTEYQPVTFVDPDYFQCSYDQTALQLRCQRYGSPSNTVGYFSFRLCNSTYCDPGCVRILSSRGEEIREENTDVVKTSNVSCEQSTTSVTDTTSQVSTRSFQRSTLTTLVDLTLASTTFAGIETGVPSEASVPVIVGATLASLVVITAIVAGVLLWRRCHSSRKGGTTNKNHASSRPNLSDSVIYNNQFNSNINDLQNPGLLINHSKLPQSSGLTITETEVNTKQSKQARNQGSSYINANRISTESGYEKAKPGLPGHGYINNSTPCPVTKDHEHHYEELVAVDLYINSQPSPKEENLKSNNISSVSWKTKDVNYKKDKDTNEIINSATISTQAASCYEEADAKRSKESNENNSEFSRKTYYNTCVEGSSENCEGSRHVHNDPYYNYAGLGTD